MFSISLISISFMSKKALITIILKQVNNILQSDCCSYSHLFGDSKSFNLYIILESIFQNEQKSLI